jgi:hypothetical protein
MVRLVGGGNIAVPTTHNPSARDQDFQFSPDRFTWYSAEVRNRLKVDRQWFDLAHCPADKFAVAHGFGCMDGIEGPFSDNRHDQEQVEISVAGSAAFDQVARQRARVTRVQPAKSGVALNLYHHRLTSWPATCQ